MSHPTLWATTTVPVGWSLLSRRRYPPCSSTPRQGSTALVTGRTSGALRRRLLVVDVPVTLVLLAATNATGGHSGLAEKDGAGVAPTHKLEQLLHFVGWDPGVVAGPLRDLDTEGDHGVAQAGHQGPRRVTVTARPASPTLSEGERARPCLRVVLSGNTRPGKKPRRAHTHGVDGGKKPRAANTSCVTRSLLSRVEGLEVSLTPRPFIPSVPRRPFENPPQTPSKDPQKTLPSGHMGPVSAEDGRSFGDRLE